MTRRPDLTTLLDDDSEPLYESDDDSPGTLRVRSKTARRQAFLVGATIYLRPIELADAQCSMLWRPSPFPVPADICEAQLNESVPEDLATGTRRLIACRRTDNRPVGSASVSTEDQHTSCISFFTPPVFGPDRAAEITAEMIRLLVPWLIHEHDQMTVRFEIPAGDPVLTRAARVTGMKLAHRLREALLLTDGSRHDLECWQALHPTWQARFGPQPEAVLGNAVQAVRSPARHQYTGRAVDPPQNALIVGNRVYLRPIEQADAEEMARWSMRETDTSFDTGRTYRSPISYWHWNRKNAPSEPPTWVRFAICLIHDGTVIGSIGLGYIDWLNKTAETETEITRGEFRGGGYGTEAKHLLLEYGFNMLGLHMVKSVAWAFNARSCDALRKQGYRDAGHIQWAGIKSGEMADRLVFDLLASEWRAARE